MKLQGLLAASVVAVVIAFAGAVAAGTIVPFSVLATTGDCAGGGAVTDPANNPGLVSDCETLLAARDTLAGTASLNWADNTPISDWDGITVEGDPARVTQLVLFGPVRGELLTGQIPPELGSLSALQVLRLMFNQLEGDIPAELGNLTDLRELDLSGNRLTGGLPPELGSLSSLQVLRLIFNELDGSIPSQLGSLSDLRALWLSYNELSGEIPQSLANLTNLDTLYLGGNDLTGCIPDGLRDVESNDFDELGLPFCASHPPGAPTVITAATGAYMVRVGSPIPVTATFSEPVFGLTVGDVTVANGAVSNLTGSDGDSVYTFDVVPESVGSVTVDIGAGVAEDGDDIGNAAATQLVLGLPYDDDHDGVIGGAEILRAVRDYFADRLTGPQILALVRLYFASPG